MTNEQNCGTVGVEVTAGQRIRATIYALVRMSVIIREYAVGDRPLVADAWLNVLRSTSRETKRSEWHNFRSARGAEIDAILDDPRTKIRIAAPPDDDVTCFGFFVWRPPEVLHMIFVKKPFRRAGIARQLLEGVQVEGATFTHWTRDVAEWIFDKYTSETGKRDKWGNKILDYRLKYDPNWRMGCAA